MFRNFSLISSLLVVPAPSGSLPPPHEVARLGGSVPPAGGGGSWEAPPPDFDCVFEICCPLFCRAVAKAAPPEAAERPDDPVMESRVKGAELGGMLEPPWGPEGSLNRPPHMSRAIIGKREIKVQK